VEVGDRFLYTHWRLGERIAEVRGTSSILGRGRIRTITFSIEGRVRWLTLPERVLAESARPIQEPLWR